MQRAFANYFRCGFNEHEVVIDFGQQYEDDPVPVLNTRIITTRAYARRLLELLEISLAQQDAESSDPQDPPKDSRPM